MYLNRKDAGNKLGKALEKFRSAHPLILGIPRGGVEVGYYVALHLECEFDVVIIRKLGHPQQPEAAFGALAEDGSLFLHPSTRKYVSRTDINNVVEQEKTEIKRRIDTYRKGKDLPNLTDRVVILVDDGIATGATLFAALTMCRKRNPDKLIVAAPVSGHGMVSKLEEKADEVIIPEKKDSFFAVSQGYQDFMNLADKQVIHFLELWREKSIKRVDSD